MVVLLCGLLSPAAFADTAIQHENALPGTTAWQVRSSDHITLYGSQIGIAPGEHVDIHVSTEYRYRLAVYRLGWYGGAGARLITCVPGCDADEQGQPLSLIHISEPTRR